MGQRANCIIIQDQQWTLYYDHWIANRIDFELFWGPEYADELIRNMKWESDKSNWLDEVWCEGAALMDLDNKVLLWFGGENACYDYFWRQTLLFMMQFNWPGWQIVWASQGIVDLAQYLGVNSGPLMKDLSNDSPYHLQVNTRFPQDNNILFSTEIDNEILMTRLCGDANALLFGETQLDELTKIPMRPNIDFKGEGLQGGLHLRFADQTMYYWICDVESNLSKRMDQAWPNWHCENVSVLVEKHFLLCRGRVFGVEPAHSEAHYRCILDSLAGHASTTYQNPMEGILDLFSNRNIEVNPDTRHHVKSVGSRKEKLSLLSWLSRQFLGDK